MYLRNSGNAGAGSCQFTFHTLHATSGSDGSSLESVAAAPPPVGSAIFRMPGAKGYGRIALLLVCAFDHFCSVKQYGSTPS